MTVTLGMCLGDLRLSDRCKRECNTFATLLITEVNTILYIGFSFLGSFRLSICFGKWKTFLYDVVRCDGVFPADVSINKAREEGEGGGEEGRAIEREM